MQTEPLPNNPTFPMSPFVNMGLTIGPDHASTLEQGAMPQVAQNKVTDARNSPRTEGHLIKTIPDLDTFGLPSWKTLRVASSEPSDSSEHGPDEDAGGDELDTDDELFREKKGSHNHEATDPVHSGYNSSSRLFTEHEVSVAPSTPPRKVVSISHTSRSPSKFVGVIVPRSAQPTPSRHMSLHMPSTTTFVPDTAHNDASDNTAVQQCNIDGPIMSSSGSKSMNAGVKIPSHTLTTANVAPASTRTTLQKPNVAHDESLVGALTAAFTKNAQTSGTFVATMKDVDVSNDELLGTQSILATPVQDRLVKSRPNVQKRVHFDLDDIEDWLETDYATVLDNGSVPSSMELLEVTLEALRQVHTGPGAPDRTQKSWEHDPNSLTENYLLRVGEWFGQDALKNTKPMGYKYPKALTKSAQRSRDMSMEVDTANEDIEIYGGTYLGKRKRPDDGTDKQAPFEAITLFTDKQDSSDITDIDMPPNDRIQMMERQGFNERPISLIQKLVKGKRAMEPKELRELHIWLSDIKRTEHVNWSGNLGKVMWESLRRLSFMEEAPKKLRSSALQIFQYWEARMGP